MKESPTQKDSDEPADIDTTNIFPTLQFVRQAGSEIVKLYPDAGDTEYGVLRTQYDGYPAYGVVLEDVVGWELVDYEFDDEDDWFDSGVVSEMVEDVLFRKGSRAYRRVEINDAGDHIVELYEIETTGDKWYVELETENKRRVY